MKNTKILSLALLSSVLLSSCIKEAYHDSYLPADKKQEIASKDPDKVFSADEQNIYFYFQQYVLQDMSHCYFGQKGFDFLSSLMGNDMCLTGDFAMSFYHYLCDYRGADFVATANRYSEYYKHIALSCSILDSMPDDDNPAVLRYRAVALTERGYAYWMLTNLYQYAYYVGADDTKWGKGKVYDHSQLPCVPLVTEKPEHQGDQPRATLDAIYEQLLSDLEEAYEIFEKIGMIRTESPTDIDGCVAATYLYRAYMVKHEWEKAAKYAQVVMDNVPILTTKDQIMQGFSDITLPDVVFGCDITPDNSTLYMSYFSQMDAYGKGYGGIGVWRVGFKPFVDKIADNDIRLNWFCNHKRSADNLLPDTTVPADVPYQSVKFVGAGRKAVKALKEGERSPENWHLGDYIYLRSEEAWFTKAEALAHANDLNGARDVLRGVMSSRVPDYYCPVSDKAGIIEEINFQKRVEFWGEGIEFIDNRRLNIPVDRLDATWGAANNNHYEPGKIRLEQEADNFLYQIPTREMETNTALGPNDQNGSKDDKEEGAE